MTETTLPRPETTVTLSIYNTEREIGITYRQCDHWTRLGLLKPLHLGGSGHSREWTRAELDVARLMGRLVKAGMKPAVAAAIARSGDARYEIADGIFIEVAA
jgi:DNA-binding transcriptional MerR regulator